MYSLYKINQSIQQDSHSPPTHFAGEKGAKKCIFHVYSNICIRTGVESLLPSHLCIPHLTDSLDPNPFLKGSQWGLAPLAFFFFFLFLRAKCTFCLLELLFFHNRDSELKKKNTYQSLHWSKAFSPIVWIKSITEMFVKASEESCFTAQKINIRISCVKSTSLKYYG